MKSVLNAQQIEELGKLLGRNFEEFVPLGKYTTANVGGSADAVCIINNSSDLETICTLLWRWNIPFRIFGKGSNVLVSDKGIHEVVIINRSKNIEFNEDNYPISVFTESGVNFGSLARQAALRGLSGLEWVNSVPGTVGGGVYGNAGAHGSDTQQILLLAEILHPIHGKKCYSAADMYYAYRSSAFKRNHEPVIILNATFRLEKSTREDVEGRMAKYMEHRQSTQPPGASLGSMFKNPPGDYAARLIEAAGLKGTKIGGAEISKRHANFFVNDENASANDIYQLTQLAKTAVKQNFNHDLELEIELIGEWDAPDSAALEN
ncbi:MAG: UDP-N-acetylmuramate dehydrogenase [Anaerolineaceae bacterium]|nr:UDP-N-acetylmuramate dehydrogenase [Anaerolineaceae bacterium]